MRVACCVGVAGFEPTTSCSQSRCATKLRHTPSFRACGDSPYRQLRSLAAMAPPAPVTVPDPDSLAQLVTATARINNITAAEFDLVRLGTSTVFASSDRAVVAKVPLSGVRVSYESVVENIAFVMSLADCDAPLLQPLGPPRRLPDGQAVTFWPRADPAPPRLTPTQTAALINRCHAVEQPRRAPEWTPLSYHVRRRARTPIMAALGVPADLIEELTSRLGAAVETLERLLDSDHTNRRWVLVHGDIHPGNIMTYRGDLALIDFDDLCWGPAEADVSVMTQNYERLSDTPEDVDEFLKAYTRTDHLDPVLMRHIRVANELTDCLWIGCLWGRTPGAADELIKRFDSLNDPTGRWSDF